jgi:LPXTG-site transpeptidase (sortase) family protein
MTDRLRLLTAVALLGLGLVAIVLGGSAYLQAWHASREHAQSAEADRAERQLTDPSLQPEWVEDSSSGAAAAVQGASTLSDDALAPSVDEASSFGSTNDDPGADTADTEPPEPRAAAGEIELVGVDFRFFDPPEAGAHARVAIELRSHSALATDSIVVSIPSRWFEDYRVIGAIPSVLQDRAGSDGSRRFNFPGLAPAASATLELHLGAAGDNVSPPEVRVALASGDEIGQAQPKTVAPRPRPGPANAVNIPRLGIQARVIPTVWEPVPFLVGQIRDSANLSEGNSVLIGHLGGPAGNVFARLDRAQPGDQVIATSRGLDYHFVVSETTVLPNVESGPLQKTDSPRVTLMTCTGQYNPVTQDYSHRLWVVAEPPELAEKTIAANAARAAAAAAEAERAARIAATAQANPTEPPAPAPAAEAQRPAAAGPRSGAPVPPAVAQVAPESAPGPDAQPAAASALRPAQSSRPASAGLTIQAPAGEARVPRRFVVKGFRATPVDPALHAWLLVRAEMDGSRWYLYPREILARPDGAWEADLDLGGPPNVRHEIRVGVVDARTHAALARRAAERPNEPLDELPRGFSDEAGVVVVRG